MTDHEDSILAIERIVLATMMLRPGDCWRIDLKPEHMASEQHADILQAILDRSGDSLPVDPMSLADWFEQCKQRSLGILAVGIASDALITPVPEVYAHRVLTAWRQRKARDIGTALLKSTDEAAVDHAIAQLMNLHATEQNHEWDAKQATVSAFKELTTIHNSGGKLPGITTGLADVDQKLGGLHRGDMIVVGARAAMGKTALLLGMARAAALEGQPVGIISGEQPVEQVALRMLSSAARIESMKFRNARFADEDWQKVYGAVEGNSALPMWFLDRSAPTMAEVVRVGRRWKHKHGIKALYVDYLQRIVGEGERKFEQVGNVAKGLKNLARDLDIPVIVLAQVGRDVEKRANPVPKMSDLSDSSEIEKEADQVLMLYRAGYYDEKEDQTTARIIVEKNRHGPTGYIEVEWNGGLMTFSNQGQGSFL